MFGQLLIAAMVATTSQSAAAAPVVAARPVIIARPATVMSRPATPMPATKATTAPRVNEQHTTTTPAMPVIIPARATNSCSDDRRKKNEC